MHTWQRRHLSDLCSTITVGHVSSMTSEYVSRGVPFLRSKNVKPGRLDLSDLVFTRESFHQRLKKSQLRANDIVIVRTGTPGSAALIPKELGPANCSDIIIARPGEHVNPRFLCYAINATAGSFVAAHTVGAVQQHFNIGSARKLQILTPPRAEQQAIAEILGALDDKIAANERIISTTRELGKSMFRAHVEGPNHQLTRLTEITTGLMRGGAPKYTDPKSGMVVVNQKCVRRGRIDLERARHTAPTQVRGDRLLSYGDVLVNSTGVGTLGRVGRWDHDIDATVDSHVTIVRFDFGVVAPIIGAYALFAAQPRIEAMGEGSTGQTELSRIKLGQLVVTLPSGDLSGDLADSLTALEHAARARLDEIRTLEKLRDTLLPQLVTGKLRIKDVESTVEAVV
ncbi:restriction endonuclease subunit S [Streptomyces sp. NPDC088350]|uniref:restriction endonuclease subunit S n=1 Tax=Streptomyces sp. NPDC088350 TaxID=3365854 RepID=UPI0037F3A4BF